VFPELWDGVWSVHLTALSKICDFHYSFLAARLLLHMFPAAKEVLQFATTFEKDFKFQGRIYGEGAGGAHPLPAPHPEITYAFLIQLVFRKKQKQKEKWRGGFLSTLRVPLARPVKLITVAPANWCRENLERKGERFFYCLTPVTFHRLNCFS